jgi:hypothetical protein
MTELLALAALLLFTVTVTGLLITAVIHRAVPSGSTESRIGRSDQPSDQRRGRGVGRSPDVDQHAQAPLASGVD